MGGAPVTPPSSSPAQAPPPQPQIITSDITLQAPLSRRGKGPGLVLVLNHYAAREAKEGCLDPPPLKKWAEEGFAVVQLLVPGKVDGEFPLQKALDVLRDCEQCEFGNGVGLISYLSRIPYYLEEAACQNPAIKALISYGGKSLSTLSSTALPPQLIHVAGLPDSHRRESCSLPLVGGPFFDLEAVWEEHTKFEFGERDVEKTMATMVDQPYVNHIPTMTGGVGQERLTAFYTHHFVFSNPPDTALALVSRTVGIDRVIDEFIFTLTHTKEVPWLLPGIPPTGKPLAIPFTSVVAMRGDRLCHEHISWDHATALKQLGLLPEYVSFPYDIEGAAPPEGKRFEVRLPVVDMEGSRKLVDESCEESNALMSGRWRMVDDV
ncbi:uncharacterized protein J4E84_009526 [Alternaria hordeiaustralica]|uniref:uncharacterized protein n=1 Tax=Alternaria hordeiaustralica TaxID=1187925 RepID=UPI0020C4BC45|nr:uncharacterized protein J4E84_009526 [Alternaria hordeiaustralica]KAI4676691.1 hypothetical protein J4E84_009526 [Alternaria hordeiaustralica]